MSKIRAIALIFWIIFLLTSCKNNEAGDGAKECAGKDKGKECTATASGKPDLSGKKWYCQGDLASKTWQCQDAGQ